jgi:hypothetical protein
MTDIINSDEIPIAVRAAQTPVDDSLLRLITNG